MTRRPYADHQAQYDPGIDDLRDNVRQCAGAALGRVKKLVLRNRITPALLDAAHADLLRLAARQIATWGTCPAAPFGNSVAVLIATLETLVQLPADSAAQRHFNAAWEESAARWQQWTEAACEGGPLRRRAAGAEG